MSTSAQGTRNYRGVTMEERRSTRRAELLRAAIRVYGERGYAASTVRGICHEAGLSERYFYESFADGEAVLIAAFQQVTHDLISDMREAAGRTVATPCARQEAMLGVFFAALRHRPAHARVFLVEIGGVGPAVDVAVEAALRDYGELLLRSWSGAVVASPPLTRQGVVGALMHIAIGWARGGYAQSLDELVSTGRAFCQLLVRSDRDL